MLVVPLHAGHDDGHDQLGDHDDGDQSRYVTCHECGQHRGDMAGGHSPFHDGGHEEAIGSGGQDAGQHEGLERRGRDVSGR